MADKDNLIGLGRCPCCGSDKAVIKFSAKNLAYLTCNGCNVQIFCRSDNSDTRLRAMVHKTNVQAETKPAKPPEKVAAIEPPKPPPTPKKEADKPGFSWGFLGAQNG
jgi:hypothetical protein